MAEYQYCLSSEFFSEEIASYDEVIRVVLPNL